MLAANVMPKLDPAVSARELGFADNVMVPVPEVIDVVEFNVMPFPVAMLNAPVVLTVPLILALVDNVIPPFAVSVLAPRFMAPAVVVKVAEPLPKFKLLDSVKELLLLTDNDPGCAAKVMVYVLPFTS